MMKSLASWSRFSAASPRLESCCPANSARRIARNFRQRNRHIPCHLALPSSSERTPGLCRQEFSRKGHRRFSFEMRAASCFLRDPCRAGVDLGDGEPPKNMWSAIDSSLSGLHRLQELLIDEEYFSSNVFSARVGLPRATTFDGVDAVAAGRDAGRGAGAATTTSSPSCGLSKTSSRGRASSGVRLSFHALAQEAAIDCCFRNVST